MVVFARDPELLRLPRPPRVRTLDGEQRHARLVAAGALDGEQRHARLVAAGALLALAATTSAGS